MHDHRHDPTEERASAAEADAEDLTESDPEQRLSFGDRAPGHPSQAEGEDPDDPESGAQFVRPAGHPSQAEGEPQEDSSGS